MKFAGAERRFPLGKRYFFCSAKWRTCDLQKDAIYRYHKDMQTIDMEEMQMFKKVMAIILALPMLFCLAACGKEDMPADAAGVQSGAPGAALAGDASAGTEGAASAPVEKEKQLDELVAETNPAHKYEELIAARDISHEQFQRAVASAERACLSEDWTLSGLTAKWNSSLTTCTAICVSMRK